MKHRRQGTAPDSEAQATAWLAWLARGMQQHGQTIFLIEQLQPSWLLTRNQRWVYILTSRLIWGGVSGLIIGLIGGLFVGLFGRQSSGLFGQQSSELFFGLIGGLLGGMGFGLIAGLIAGLADVVRFARNRSQSTQNAAVTLRQLIKSSLLFGLSGGLVGGLINGLLGGLFGWQMSRLFGGLIFGLSIGLIGGLSIGLIFAPFWVFRSFGRNPRNEIQTVESIRISWAYVPKAILIGLAGALIGALIGGLLGGPIGELIVMLFGGLFGGPIGELIVGLFGGQSGGLFSGLSFGLIDGLIAGLIGGLIVGLMRCFRPGIRELKTVPNQGIRLSLRSGSLMGGVGGLGLGLFVGLVGGWINGLVYGALGGLCIGLWYGGLDVIQHYILRILLWRAGAMPRDYARFLDYAAEELTFLQKVGGGYIFVHRYLLEYFAAMELPGQAVGADGDTVSQPAVTTGESV